MNLEHCFNNLKALYTVLEMKGGQRSNAEIFISLSKYINVNLHISSLTNLFLTADDQY